MLQRLCVCVGIGLCVWFLAGSTSAASVQYEDAGAENVAEASEFMLRELDLSTLQRELEEVLDLELNFEDTVVQAVKEEGGLPFQSLTGKLVEEVKMQWARQKHTFFSLLTLTICAAFLTNFSGIFKSQQIAEVSFEITYMLLFLILLGSFEKATQVTAQVLGRMEDFIRVLIPSYFLSVSLASSSVSAGVFYPFLLGMISVIHGVMEKLLLPLLDGYVILVFVNHLTEEAHLSQLSAGVLKGSGWLLRTMMVVVAGFHVIQGMISPALDSFKATAFGRAAAAIPGIGNLAGSVTDVILGSGILIKNGIGAVGLLILLAICLVPLVQLGCWVVLLEVLAAVIQPVSDKRMVGCIAGVSEGGKLLFRMVFTVAALFMLSIAMVAVATGVRV